MFLLPVVLMLVGDSFTKHLSVDAIVIANPNEVTSRESVTTAPQTAAPATVSPSDDGDDEEETLPWSSAPGQRLPLPDDGKLFPSLANGHLGFTVFGDAIYMNGLYSGYRGLSHRARIANVANLRLTVASGFTATVNGGNEATTRMDFRSGTFCVDYRGPNNSYRVQQLIYPHQFYNRAIVNQFTIERLDAEDDITVGISQNITCPGSEDILFDSIETILISHDAERWFNLTLPFQFPRKQQLRDEYSTTTATGAGPISSSFKVHRTCGSTVMLEDPAHQPNQQRRVCVLWNHVPEELTLKRSERTVSYKFIMTADESASFAREELVEVFLLKNEYLLKRHTNVWQTFWRNFDINVEGNPKLERVIHASIFYLISNFPLGDLSRPLPFRSYRFGGLSPTGLGRGGTNLDDYEGHSFWDTEIWMFPVVNIIESKLARMLIDYRFHRLSAARDNALNSGYIGARYPWESASSGVEVTQPCCPEVAKYQQHISADISFALRNFFATNQDLDWLQTQGCLMAQEIAQFWSSRLSFDPVTGLYDIEAVMGPDEDHENVTNNAYTNVIAAYALYFGDLTKCLCNGKPISHKSVIIGYKSKRAPIDHDGDTNWSTLAGRIKLLYDPENDYHPQYLGYQLGTIIKQADTVLLGYPLQYQGMTAQTRSNDLRYYEPVTRRSGPAMTWAMHAINHLDLNEIPQALENFERSYEPYVKGPHLVWNEIETGMTGATNFITGAGGFLQAVVYGFGGIRIFLDRLQIKNSQLPTDSTQLSIKGLKYLDASLSLNITRNGVMLEATHIGRSLSIQIGNEKRKMMLVHKIYHISDVTVLIKATRDIYEYCQLPEEIITPINVEEENDKTSILNEIRKNS
ncbi:protein-glucosylgalactosylhydroxylysine glucosidase-like [Malaya genurostris]|uniref:protein-glucosylgalactosylhydroxylysine glucosidase-like n=1 Tax=Malaya genurostris TaxID=325434 RepID=UPI0026F3D53B|nr:protein-glucosylgalactosylhydroxylysine glucosidase-like [Malaya genurostris]